MPVSFGVIFLNCCRQIYEPVLASLNIAEINCNTYEHNKQFGNILFIVDASCLNMQQLRTPKLEYKTWG